MDSCKKPLAYFTVEKFLDDFICMITRAKAVTMPYQQAVVANTKFLRRSVNRDIKFFCEIIKHPHVVIPGEENYRYACITNFSKLTLQTDKPFWNCMLVFKPEIENV